MNLDAIALGPDIATPGPTAAPPPTLHAAADAHLASFADALLRPDLRDRSPWLAQARRLAVGLGLAALFGGALGLREGGASIAAGALGVSSGLAAVAFVGAPAFAIVLALVRAPIDGEALARATSRAVAKAGLLLGGLAPAAALYVLTLEDAITVSIVGFGALLLAGGIATSSFSRDLRERLASAAPATRQWMSVAMPAFVVFAAALALRVWWVALPLLSRGVR